MYKNLSHFDDYNMESMFGNVRHEPEHCISYIIYFVETRGPQKNDTVQLFTTQCKIPRKFSIDSTRMSALNSIQAPQQPHQAPPFTQVKKI